MRTFREWFRLVFPFRTEAPKEIQLGSIPHLAAMDRSQRKPEFTRELAKVILQACLEAPPLELGHKFFERAQGFQGRDWTLTEAWELFCDIAQDCGCDRSPFMGELCAVFRYYRAPKKGT